MLLNDLCRIVLITIVAASVAVADEPSPLEGIHRVVFLGDSITYAGHDVTQIEAYLRLRHPEIDCAFLNLGLPSETVSGLTEPGHAGGEFPRPVLQERLDRVLDRCRPDLVVACYGMNDGIYHPFDEGRFQKFQEGIRALRDRCEAAGIRITHLTPPVFDPLPIRDRTLPAGAAVYDRPYEGYDEVLERYAAWLLEQRAAGWDVVDLHGPMKRHLVEHRRREPDYHLASDGVHLNEVGHWLIARALLDHWGCLDNADRVIDDPARVFAAIPHGSQVVSLVGEKQRVARDAWLTATGHTRPGMRPGPPLDEATRQIERIHSRIEELQAASP